MTNYVDTSATEQGLVHAARELKGQFRLLEKVRWYHPRVQLARKMKPTFGPQSPTPDKDWAVTIEDSLLRETREEHVPGGLLVMVADALSYLDEGLGKGTVTGLRLCALVEQNAWEIAERFPAAPDLADLMVAQAAYIATRIRRRYPQLVTDQPSVLTRRMQATEIVRQLSVRGTATTPDTIRGWARHGRISAEELPNGHKGYLLAECLTVVTKITRE